MVGCTFQGCQYDTDQALTHAINPILADHLAMLGLHNTVVHLLHKLLRQLFHSRILSG